MTPPFPARGAVVWRAARERIEALPPNERPGPRAADA